MHAPSGHLASNLGDLGRDDDQVLLGDPLPAGLLVVEAAAVRFRVPVRRAERAAAPAREPSSPTLFRHAAHLLAAGFSVAGAA